MTGGLHIGQIFFFKVTYLCFKTSLYDYIWWSLLLTTSQSVLRWQQCTSPPLPSCPTLPSWPSQDQSVPPPLWCWPAARWGWNGVGCTPYTWDTPRGRSTWSVTFHKIRMTSQVSLVSEYTFYENGRRWIWFHNSISCLIWICQNGVIGFLTINKGKNQQSYVRQKEVLFEAPCMFCNFLNLLFF